MYARDDGFDSEPTCYLCITSVYRQLRYWFYENDETSYNE